MWLRSITEKGSSRVYFRTKVNLIYTDASHSDVTTKSDDLRSVHYFTLCRALQAFARLVLVAYCVTSGWCATADRITSIKGATTAELQALLPRIHEVAETAYPKLLNLTFDKGQSAPARFSIEIIPGAHWTGHGRARAKEIQLDADWLSAQMEGLSRTWAFQRKPSRLRVPNAVLEVFRNWDQSPLPAFCFSAPFGSSAG